MGEKILVGPITKGLKNDVTPFNVDNDAFPVLINAYQWRGRIKRKRGTSLLNRLKRYFNSNISSYGSIPTITLNGSGVGNLLTGFSLQVDGNIVPGSVTLTGSTGPTIYTDPAMNGSLSPSGTINYATGVITIAAQAGATISAIFNYYPDLPALGLEDFYTSTSSQFPGTIGFDQKYSYNILPTFPYNIYDVSFYKNLVTGTYVNYVQKTNWTPTTWNGEDYQQFWTVNYEGALWATNGMKQPVDLTKIGMQFKPIITTTVTAGGPPATVSLQITAHGLVIGDFIFVNEVVTTIGINFQTGYVTTVTDANNVIVTFPNATIAADGTGGIAQYLTSRADPTIDCLRWYDGDPTNGNATTPSFLVGKGWVNFMPPLSQEDYSIASLPEAQYYLVGARTIIPFKDRLLFFGPIIQTSSTTNKFYLKDTVIYSQNGTPFYTCSFTGNPASVDTDFFPILTPTSRGGTATAFWEDITGYGGFITEGSDQDAWTVSPNEDVIIVGFTRHQSRLVATGNDIVPFNFYTINSELGSGSTFSQINTDEGVLTKGSRGYTITSQVASKRIDLDIPDEVFETRLLDNGTERVTAQRDFINEWLYFTYPSVSAKSRFPTQTLQFNYRDNSWAIFKEAYTTYGQFRKVTGYTWGTIGTKYATWSAWNDPWSAGASTLLNPEVIAGNQQGFIMVRDDGTDEGNSLYIQNFSANNIITSPDHCLNTGDYIVISGCLGTIGTNVNGNIYKVSYISDDTFRVSPNIDSSLSYLGGGVMKRMYIPFVQTRQFPVAWSMARKTRLGPQQYLLTKTGNGQITLLIYLSQDDSNPYNAGPILLDPNSDNNALIYSTILFTCPESTNLGLTPANTNLQMPTAINQSQIWHRMNTSLIGDTVQLGFTLSDAQMRDEEFKSQFSEIELHSFILDVNPSSLLA